MNNHKRSFICFLILFLLISIKTDAGKVTVFVIGDSTASLYDASLYPRTGWAQLLQAFFNKDSVAVNDQAASGRSSKSFYDEGRWTTVNNLLKKGDYVFIQFAHNDEKTDDPARYTIPSTTYKDYITIYINGARAKGAFPVLFSSIPRNNWSGSGIQQAHKSYTEAMKQLAEALNVPFVDMEASTMAYLNTKGKTYSTDSIFNNLKANVWPNYLTGNSDGTHLQENGAYNFCKVATTDIKKHNIYPEVIKLASNIGKAVRVSAMPYPSLKGTIRGYGIFTAYSQVTLTATAISGYKFTKWTLATDTVTVSKNSSLTISADTSNVSLLARFESITSTVDVPFTCISVFPAIATDKLNIVTSEEITNIRIFNVQGQETKASSVLQNNQLDISDLRPGYYIIQIQLLSGVVSKAKFIKKFN